MFCSKRFLEKLKSITTVEIREFPDWFKSCRNKCRQFLDIIQTSFGMTLQDDPVEYGIEKNFLPIWEVSFLRSGLYIIFKRFPYFLIFYN